VLLAAFLSQVALTRGARCSSPVVPRCCELCAVFLVALQVSASVMRRGETTRAGTDALAADRARQSLLGRLAGFAVVAAALALIFALPLLAWAPPGAGRRTGRLSLALEGTLVAAAALFFAMTLAQPVRPSPQPPASTCWRARWPRSRRSPRPLVGAVVRNPGRALRCRSGIAVACQGSTL
jgi:hypothetical protein